MSARGKSQRIRQGHRWSGCRAGFSSEKSDCGKFDTSRLHAVSGSEIGAGV